jgi:hypothetical protein
MEGYFHGGKITKGKKGRKKFYVLWVYGKVHYNVVYANYYSRRTNNGGQKKKEKKFYLLWVYGKYDKA